MRRIVGALVAIAEGLESEEAIIEALHGNSHLSPIDAAKEPGPTAPRTASSFQGGRRFRAAPAHGLWLHEAVYKEPG